MSEPPATFFAAVVLAADRGPNDPVARAAGARCKALAPVAGMPMVQRVLEVLGESREVGGRVLCGPPEAVMEQEPIFRRWLSAHNVKWLPPRATPSQSALVGMDSVSPEIPILLTTADHALLNPTIVEHFCREARSSGLDAVVGLARHEHVARTYPESTRTEIRLHGGSYSGCNLFAFLSPAGRSVAGYWRRVENQRKKPMRVVGAVGWIAVLRYLLGRLSLPEAMDRLSNRVGARVGAVLLPFPEAAVDVDTVADWKLAQACAEEPRSQSLGFPSNGMLPLP